MVIRISILLTLAFLCSQSRAEEVVRIPLSEIWAIDMPGTKDARELKDKVAPGYKGPVRSRNLDFVLRLLRQYASENEAKEGSVVYGTGGRALSFAISAIGKKESHLFEPIVSGEEVSIAFFSHPCSYYIHLEKVERRDRLITIQYQTVPHFSAESTVHLALIPLGSLTAGKYRVEINQTPLAQEHIDAGFKPLSAEAACRIVCRPFSFTVEDPSSPLPAPAKDARVIPLDSIRANDMAGIKHFDFIKCNPWKDPDCPSYFKILQAV